MQGGDLEGRGIHWDETNPPTRVVVELTFTREGTFAFPIKGGLMSLNAWVDKG